MQIDLHAETLDAILGGRLRIVQPLAGYRFSIDSILLGSFAQPHRRDRVLELGAGCGVIAAIIAALRQPREVVAIEMQAELAECARRNLALNGLDRATAIRADLRTSKIAGARPGSFDYVVANPPWRASRSGRESPNASRRIARGAGGASLREFVAAAARYTTNVGKVAMIFTASRSAELLVELCASSLEPKRIRFVHPDVDSPASAIMVEARKGGGVDAIIDAPLILWEKPGVYSAEARAILIPGDGLAAAGETV
jgi:tRNA1Val (adenine37-N6)-methyltransferase